MPIDQSSVINLFNSNKHMLKESENTIAVRNERQVDLHCNTIGIEHAKVVFHYVVRFLFILFLIIFHF